MTATDVFLKFLKTELSMDEYLFFMHHLSSKRRNGKVRPVLKRGCVEEYLSSTGRTLGGFMTRLFVLCPGLIRGGMDNPIYVKIHDEIFRKYYYRDGEEYYFNLHINSKYVSIYRTRWRNFLHLHIKSEKKIDSPYKEGELYSYEYNK